MSDTPPFNPPYRTIKRTPTGIQVIETAEDGSTSLVSVDGCEYELPQVTSRTEKPAAKTIVRNTPSIIEKLSTGNSKVALYLDVPFADKDSAKSKGARWDATKKKWYLPHGTDVNVFKKWWPEDLKSAGGDKL